MKNISSEYAIAPTQNYSKSLQIGLWLARFFYRNFSLSNNFVNLAKGQELGKKADFMLG
jgi:ubiquinone biosynthesis protein COQ4